MLEASNITVKVQGKTLLSDVSMQVKPGEMLALLGPNGAGKSTLLAVLTGARKASEGLVMLEGRKLTEYPAKALAKRRAVLSQSIPIQFPFTVMEIVLMGRSPHIASSEGRDDIEIAEKALAEVDALGLKERLFPSLSGGEQQRVQLARVLAQIWQKQDAPRYLFLDEPTSAMDLKHQLSTLDKARALADEGVAVCAILHDISLAKHYADRVVLLKEGRKVADGTVKQTLTSATITDVYDIPAERLKLVV